MNKAVIGVVAVLLLLIAAGGAVEVFDRAGDDVAVVPVGAVIVVRPH